MSSDGSDAAPQNLDAAHGSDAAVADDATTSNPDATTGCIPNQDGVIDEREVPLIPGLHAVFKIAQAATVDTAGTTDMTGKKHWDLGGMLSGDHLVQVTTDSMSGRWFAADFPNATYTSKLSDSSDLLGVFQVTSSALQLLGVVSPSDGPSKTELTYDPAVVVLQFPMQLQSTWSTDATVTGLTMGLLSNFSESYQSTVDAAGFLATPFATFPVLRVSVVLTRTVALIPTVIRTKVFVTECFGSIATIVSENNEPNDEFTQAAEVRRLSP
jgi:hypothetical protein